MYRAYGLLSNLSKFISSIGTAHLVITDFNPLRWQELNPSYDKLNLT